VIEGLLIENGAECNQRVCSATSNRKTEKFVATIIGMELCPELLNWNKRFRESPPSKAGFLFHK